ncbi:MAG TPA: Rnf-Nqr domain containing protein [Methylomirabilota bacterium]|nr:Rnf-Nqr domain containing protein [Methylomirabilota bacterium]
MIGDLLWIFVSAMVINNFTLMLFLGLCPVIGVSAKVETAFRLGLADIFVLTMTSVAVWVLNTFVLVHAPYLRIIAFIVAIASLVQIVEMVIKKVSPALFRALGIYLPLITTNCAVLALAVFQTSRGYTLVEGLVFALGGGLGLMLALVLMASIREALEVATVPKLARGAALVMLISGALSLAFMGFAGLLSGE